MCGSVSVQGEAVNYMEWKSFNEYKKMDVIDLLFLWVFNCNAKYGLVFSRNGPLAIVLIKITEKSAICGCQK